MATSDQGAKKTGDSEEDQPPKAEDQPKEPESIPEEGEFQNELRRQTMTAARRALHRKSRLITEADYEILLQVKKDRSERSSKKQKKVRASKEDVEQVPMSNIDQELVDQKIKAANAEVRTEIATLGGKIDTISEKIGAQITALGSKMDGLGTSVASLDGAVDDVKRQYSAGEEQLKSQYRSVIATMVGLSVAIVLGVAGIFAWGDSRFGMGASIDQQIRTQVQEATSEQNRKMDRILDLLENQARPPT